MDLLLWNVRDVVTNPNNMGFVLKDEEEGLVRNILGYHDILTPFIYFLNG